MCKYQEEVYEPNVFFPSKKIKRRLKKTQGKAISANLLHVRKVSDGFEKVLGKGSHPAKKAD